MSCHQHYRRSTWVRTAVTAVMGGLALALFLADVAVGTSDLSIFQALVALFAPETDPTAFIVREIRLPSALTAVTVGAALSLAGLLIQTITANPLASPTTLGITSGASFGAALAITSGFSIAGELWLGTVSAAFAAALLISGAILKIGHRNGMSPAALILAGIVMNFFFMALQELRLYLASPETAQLINGWTFGNLERAGKLAAAVPTVALAAALVVTVPAVWHRLCLGRASCGGGRKFHRHHRLFGARRTAHCAPSLRGRSALSDSGHGFHGSRTPFGRIRSGQNALRGESHSRGHRHVARRRPLPLFPSHPQSEDAVTDQPTLSLTVKDLAVRFNRRSVLNGISFSAASGDLITVVGENAAGKTTLLKSLAGLVKYDGSVTLAEHGTALSDASVVYLPQLTAVTSHLSVFETVMLGLGHRLSWRIDDEVFDRTDAQLHAMNISRLAALPVQKLSGGQKQLVFMAQAFISRPRLLLLDEPTSALDLKHQLIVMEAAKHYARHTGAVVITIAHDLTLAARFSSKLLVLSEGRVHSFGSPRDVLTPSLIADVWHVKAAVETTAAGLTVVTPLTPITVPGENDHTHDLHPEDF